MRSVCQSSIDPFSSTDSAQRCPQQHIYIDAHALRPCLVTDELLRARSNDRAAVIKSVSFAPNTKFKECSSPCSWTTIARSEFDSSELFMLFLLVVLVRFAYAGNDIPHINDFIIALRKHS